MTSAVPLETNDLLSVQDLGHIYNAGGADHEALDGLEFVVRRGEFVSIVGPSGCGKTTLLKCVSGLMQPTRGVVRLAGELVSSVPDDLAMVFQDYSRSLFPWMSVRRNIEFPLRRRKLDRDAREQRVAESLAAVSLGGFENHYPWQLSGGMQQRVSIARALAYRSRILLMDEPFASVDAQTRADLEDLVLDVRRRFDMTILFVTHDIDESIYLSDRVLVLSRSPAHALADLAVELSHPRDQIETREQQRFVHLRGEVARLIRFATTNGAAGRYDVSEDGASEEDSMTAGTDRSVGHALS